MKKLIGALAALTLSLAAQSQTYPSKPIRFVVPFAPGGTSEIVARSVAQELTTQLGQSVYVENKAGGAGTIAMGDVKNSPADGYTIVLGHVGTLAVNPYAMKNHPYDVDKDFIPVALLARVPNVFVVNADAVKATDLKEFIALAKAKPGSLNYGSAGNGSSGHLAFEYLKMVSGADIQHVPYKGTGPMLQDLLGGRIESSNAGAPALLPQIKSGKLRAIAVGRTSASRRFPTWAPWPKRATRLRDLAVVRRDGEGGHAAGDREEAQRRDQQGAAVEPGHAALRHRQRRCGVGHAGSSSARHREGAGALARGGAQGEHHDRVTRRAPAPLCHRPVRERGIESAGVPRSPPCAKPRRSWAASFPFFSR
jgi:tripartite-type tricarboxylate transporter receptor subunit TctC